VCVDEFNPQYLEQGIADGILPKFAAMNGFHATLHCAMRPSPIATTFPSSPAPVTVHGIVGNCFFDRTTGKEEMNTDESFLQNPTNLKQMAKRGVRVVATTAKDKLRAILRHGSTKE